MLKETQVVGQFNNLFQKHFNVQGEAMSPFRLSVATEDVNYLERVQRCLDYMSSTLTVIDPAKFKQVFKNSSPDSALRAFKVQSAQAHNDCHDF
jgi:hypothetical protein